MVRLGGPWSRALWPAIAIVSVASGQVRRSTWPTGPFVTSGRWITDAAGDYVTYAGVNWPAHDETMIPEGLQYQSIATIVSHIKSLGMNVIRLTYATEMIDQIDENGGNDIPIQTAFVKALGHDNGTAVYKKVIANNPSFGSAITRLQVSLSDTRQFLPLLPACSSYSTPQSPQ